MVMELLRLQSMEWITAQIHANLFPSPRELEAYAFGVLPILVSVSSSFSSCHIPSFRVVGALTAKELPIATTAYNTPRYVSFLQGGTQLLVAFMEKSMV